MDIKKLADVKDRFADYEKIFNSGDYDKAADILSAILERIEECTDERKAGTMDDTSKNRKYASYRCSYPLPRSYLIPGSRFPSLWSLADRNQYLPPHASLTRPARC